jgi:hypothetical protein
VCCLICEDTKIEKAIMSLRSRAREAQLRAAA